MFNWLFKRLFSPERVGYLVKLAEPHIQEQIDLYAKDMVIGLLSDEEIASALNQYSKTLVDTRYHEVMQKFGGFLGGTQKGINAQIGQQIDSINPLANIVDEEGNFSLTNIVKMFLGGKLLPTQQPQAVSGYSGGRRPIS